jgi:alkylation response protein AidB-like acyl-CoA dehydrogenase
MTFPEKYGGHGRSALDRFVVSGELLASGAPVAMHWIADRQSGPLLLKYGNEQQRQKILPGIAKGDIFFAIGMSEPDSGSDLASVKTRAVKVPGGWKITGTKVWTSHAHESDYAITLCRTDPNEPENHKALTQVVLDLRAPGVTVRPIRLITGEAHFCEIILDEAFVPDEMVVGDVGQGWPQVVNELAFERSGPERFLSTYPLFTALVDWLRDHREPGDEELIGRLLAEYMALYAMSMDVARVIDEGKAPATEAAMVKVLGTRVEASVAELVRDRVPMEQMPPAMEELYRQAVLHRPAFSLRGGTTEVLQGLVARGLRA